MLELITLTAIIIFLGASQPAILTPTPPTPAPIETPAPLPDDYLAPTLITLDDLPSGWAASFPPKFGLLDTEFSNFLCGEIPITSIARAQSEFTKGMLGPFINQTVNILPDPAKDMEITRQLIAEWSIPFFCPYGVRRGGHGFDRGIDQSRVRKNSCI